MNIYLLHLAPNDKLIIMFSMKLQCAGILVNAKNAINWWFPHFWDKPAGVAPTKPKPVINVMKSPIDRINLHFFL
jgi:hypothetical protein